MSRGRKPAPKLATRDNQDIDAVPTICPQAPEVVAMNPYAEQAWHLVMDNQTRFRRQELPLIEQYCMAYAISRQALDNMSGEYGTIKTTCLTNAGNVVQNPDFRTWKDAVNQMRQLSGVLGLDTLTAERLKLTQAATTSLAADIPKKVMEAMRTMQGSNG